MNTVICAINSKYIHSSLAPWYLAAGVEAYCDKHISAKVIEGSINEDIDKIANKIIEEKPRAIGLSCYIWNIEVVKALAVILKRALPEAAIILGGPEVSFNPDEVLRDMPCADFVISGEEKSPSRCSSMPFLGATPLPKFKGCATVKATGFLFRSPIQRQRILRTRITTIISKRSMAE